MPSTKRRPVFLDRRPVEIAEPAAECDQVGVAQHLVAEQHDGVVMPSLQDPLECGVVERPEVAAPHLGAQCRSGRNHVDRIGRAAAGR